MTSRTLNNPREYGVTDIGDVLSPGVTDKSFSLFDIEDVLDPPELDAGTPHTINHTRPPITRFIIRPSGWL